jgi:hypothetical protein
MTPFSKKVEKYCDTFRKLKDDFVRETTQVTAITVFQLAPKVDEILSELKDTCKYTSMSCNVDRFLMTALTSCIATSERDALRQGSGLT